MSINRFVGIGRVGKDPELRSTQSGKSVAEFSLAISKRVKPTDGSPDSDWFSVTCWGQTAEFVGKYVGKGRLVSVDGRLEVQKWNDKDGNQREKTVIVADNVNALDRPKDDDRPGAGGTAPQRTSAPAEDSYDPFSEDE